MMALAGRACFRFNQVVCDAPMLLQDRAQVIEKVVAVVFRAGVQNRKNSLARSLSSRRARSNSRAEMSWFEHPKRHPVFYRVCNDGRV